MVKPAQALQVLARIFFAPFQRRKSLICKDFLQVSHTSDVAVVDVVNGNCNSLI